MDATKTMLRAIINGQSAMKQDLLGEIRKVDTTVKKLEKNVDLGFEVVKTRMDKLGKSLAYLEDDAPTREEFDGLEKRVVKVEQKAASI